MNIFYSSYYISIILSLLSFKLQAGVVNCCHTPNSEYEDSLQFTTWLFNTLGSEKHRPIFDSFKVDNKIKSKYAKLLISNKTVKERTIRLRISKKLAERYRDNSGPFEGSKDKFNSLMYKLNCLNEQCNFTPKLNSASANIIAEIQSNCNEHLSESEQEQLNQQVAFYGIMLNAALTLLSQLANASEMRTAAPPPYS